MISKRIFVRPGFFCYSFEKLSSAAVLVFCSLFVGNSFAQEVLVSARYENEPLSYEKDNQLHGLVFEIFQEIASELDIPYAVKTVGPLPWKRSLLYLKNSKIDALLGVERKTGVEFEYSNEPIYQTSYTIFYRSENPIEYREIEGYRGAVSVDVSIDLLKSQNESFSKLETSFTRQQNILKLLNGRIDYFIAPLLPTLNFISENHLDKRKKISFRAKPVALSSHYLAYSKEGKLLPFKNAIDKKLKEYTDKGMIGARVGEVVATWDAFDWYLENRTKAPSD